MIILDIRKVEKENPKDFYRIALYFGETEKSFSEDAPFFVSKSELAEFNITKGENRSFSSKEELIRAIYLKRGKGIAIRNMAKKSLTEKELSEKLRKREIPEDIASEILVWLKEKGLIDDGAYAQNYISYRGKRKSKKELLFELAGKGIEKSILQETLLDSEFDELPHATALAEKKLRSIYQGEEHLRDISKKDLERILGYLFRKGFPLDLSKKAIEKGFERILES